MIKGINVVLHEKTLSGVDSFNHEVFTTEEKIVENVLVGNPTADQVIDSTILNGRKNVFVLGIPKGDTHNWIDSVVEFDLAGHHKCKTFGAYTEGIESMIPLSWHRQIKCEEYE